MEKTPPFKIAVLGAESSGKTTLSALIAQEIGARLIDEYARTYCDKLTRKPELSDVLHIAGKQLLEYQSATVSGGKTVFDTTLHTSLIWLEDKFQYENHWMHYLASLMSFDLILVCAPDFPWEFDPLREDPHRRDLLNEKLEGLLKKLGTDFISLKGDLDVRLLTVKNLLANRS